MHRRRLDLREAAEALGTSVDAVRKRLKRGTLDSERGADGKLYVFIDDGLDDGAPRSDSDVLTSDVLISELRDQIKYLREENQRKDHLLAAALERIPPQLEAPTEEAPSDERESPVPKSEGQHPTPEEPRRGFWARLFGS